MFRYAATIFLSAFLLFQVQPLLGRYILPWFGGSPAVWTTCMLVFQMLLLAGYGYAHWLAERFSARTQATVHLALLSISLAFLPIVPSEVWKPTTSDAPVVRIVALLLATVGGPYLLLSTTGPLLQRWFSGSFPGRSPYRLYSLSNVGSLLALVTYPFVFEPWLTLGRQAQLWSFGYIAFGGACGYCALRVLRTAPAIDAAWQTGSLNSTADATSTTLLEHPGRARLLFWLLSSAVGSVTLLATTNQMCQEVAVVPFLWVLPLAVYLLSFIICFDNEQWYRRVVFVPLLIGSVLFACFALEQGATWSLWKQVAAYTLMLFAGCMCCHGELVRSKPNPRYLTLFYLTISAGGALGGLLVAIVAPAIFHGYWEYHAALLGCVLVVLYGLGSDRDSHLYNGRPIWAWFVAFCSVVYLTVYLVKHITAVEETAIASARNFYGVLRVREDGVKVEANGKRNEDDAYRTLVHGRITHGLQYLTPRWRNEPVTYYGPHSGVGLAIAHHPRRKQVDVDVGPLRIGVVGLGAGTLASYGLTGETVRFYEINPVVEQFARQYFTYLQDAQATVEVVLGDARTTMEQELRSSGSQQFDVLAIDAFSSDAIPLHLLTSEAFAIYRRHLRDDGMLVLHVSSHHVKLNPVVRGLADQLGWETVLVDADEHKDLGEYRSEWLIVTNNREFLAKPEIIGARTEWPDDFRPIVWTDDFCSLWQVIELD
jgi:hypothetical protein